MNAIEERVVAAWSAAQEDVGAAALRTARERLREGNSEGAEAALASLDEDGLMVSLLAVTGTGTTEVSKDILDPMLERLLQRFADFAKARANRTQGISRGFLAWWFGRVREHLSTERTALVAQHSGVGGLALGDMARSAAEGGDPDATRRYVEAMAWTDKVGRSEALALLALQLAAKASSTDERRAAEGILTEAITLASATPLVDDGQEEAEALGAVLGCCALGRAPRHAREPRPKPNATMALSADHPAVALAVKKLLALGRKRSRKDGRSYGLHAGAIACAQRAAATRETGWLDPAVALADSLYSEHLILSARIWIADAAALIGGDAATRASASTVIGELGPGALRDHARAALALARFDEREAVLDHFVASNDADAILSALLARVTWGHDPSSLLDRLTDASDARSVAEYFTLARTESSTHQETRARKEALNLLLEAHRLDDALKLGRDADDYVVIARRASTDEEWAGIWRGIEAAPQVLGGWGLVQLIQLADAQDRTGDLERCRAYAARLRTRDRGEPLTELATAFIRRGDEAAFWRSVEAALARPTEPLWKKTDIALHEARLMAERDEVDRAFDRMRPFLSEHLFDDPLILETLNAVLDAATPARFDGLLSESVEALLACRHILLKGDFFEPNASTSPALLGRAFRRANAAFAKPLEDRLLAYWVEKRDEAALGSFFEQRMPYFSRARREEVLGRAFPEQFLNRDRFLHDCHAAVRIDTAWPLAAIADHLEGTNDRARIDAAADLAKAGRDADALAVAESIDAAGSCAHALRCIVEQGSEDGRAAAIAKRARKLKQSKLDIEQRTLLFEHRTAIYLTAGETDVKEFDKAVKATRTLRKTINGRQTDLAGMARLAALVEKHPGAFADAQLTALAEGLVERRASWFMERFHGIYFAARPSGRAELARFAEAQWRSAPAAERAELGLALGIALARVEGMTEPVRTTLDAACTQARESTGLYLVPFVGAIAAHLPADARAEWLERCLDIAEAHGGAALGVVYSHLRDLGRPEAARRRIQDAHIPEKVRTKVIWNAVQSDLASADPVAAILAWFSVVPRDPSLTRARIEWLRLALLKAGDAETAEQIRRVVGEA